MLAAGLADETGGASLDALFQPLVKRQSPPAIFTAATDVVVARATAIDLEKAGRMVQVCAWCQTPELKRMLSDLKNVSHGICNPCRTKMEGRSHE